MLVWYQMYTWVTSDRSAAWNWAPRVGRIICVTALRFFLVGSSSSLSSTLPPASFPPALYHRNNWTIVQVCGVKKKCASNTQYMYWKGVLTSTCHIDLVSKSSTQELLQKFLMQVTQNLVSACSALQISGYLHPSFLGPRVLSYNRTTPCHRGTSPHGETSEWSQF